MRKVLILIVSALALSQIAGCVDMSAQEVEDCVAQGGSIAYDTANQRSCQPAFEDAGQMCTASSQCQGVCEVQGDGLTGQCHATTRIPDCGQKVFDDLGRRDFGVCI